MKYLLAIAIIMSLGGFLTTHYQYKSIKNVQAVKMEINERLPNGWLYNLNHSTKTESPRSQRTSSSADYTPRRWVITGT